MTETNSKLQLFLSHRAALIDYATPLVGCRDRAEDVVQDAWLRFARAEDSALKQPAAYLYRIVRNLALDWTRRQAGEARYARRESARAAAAAASSEDLAAGEQTLACVSRAIAELPPQTRLAFELYRFDGLTLQQVAGRLGISVATAHRLVRSALLHIDNRLQALETAMPDREK